ncbi:MAG: prephenate dehydrogenase [Anaerolineae bacterium]|nr:prephenate dehydrogenase [Anaerolineae bacterium]
MAKPRITIVGLGLVGTSFGLALRRMKGEFELVGHDRDPGAANLAKQRGALDRTEWNLPRACEGASLIILALPLGEMRKSLQAIAPDLAPGTVITDTANLKTPVLGWADELLPAGVSFVGGDPILHVTSQSASPDLFRDAVYCLASSPKASDEAIRLVANLVTELGAKPLFIDAAEHDGLLTAVAHLPTIMAAALSSATADSPPWREVRRLAGDIYEGATRLPDESAASLRDLCLNNEANIARWIDTYVAALLAWKETITSADAERIEQAFVQVIAARQKWVSDRAEGRWDMGDSVQVPAVDRSWRTLLLGGLAGRDRKR